LFAKHKEKRERHPRFSQHCQLASPHPPHGPRHSQLPDSTTHSPSPSPFLLSPLLRLCPIRSTHPRRISVLQLLFLLRFSLSLRNWCAAQLKTWYEIDSTLSRCSPSLCPPIDPLPRCQYLLAPPLSNIPLSRYIALSVSHRSSPQLILKPDSPDLRRASATYCASGCFSRPVPIRLDSSHTPDESATEAGFSASRRRNLKPARRGSHGILFR
jgi:hypothetical protein